MPHLLHIGTGYADAPKMSVINKINDTKCFGGFQF